MWSSWVWVMNMCRNVTWFSSSSFRIGCASQPVSNSLAQPNVFLEGRQLSVQFSGLAPGFAGLWQLNVLIPRDAPTGPTLGLTVVNGLTSNRVSVTVVD